MHRTTVSRMVLFLAALFTARGALAQRDHGAHDAGPPPLECHTRLGSGTAWQPEEIGLPGLTVRACRPHGSHRRQRPAVRAQGRRAVAFTVYDKPGVLDPMYGGSPTSTYVYLRLRAPRMEMHAMH